MNLPPIPLPCGSYTNNSDAQNAAILTLHVTDCTKVALKHSTTRQNLTLPIGVFTRSQSAPPLNAPRDYYANIHKAAAHKKPALLARKGPQQTSNYSAKKRPGQTIEKIIAKLRIIPEEHAAIYPLPPKQRTDTTQLQVTDKAPPIPTTTEVTQYVVPDSLPAAPPPSILPVFENSSVKGKGITPIKPVPHVAPKSPLKELTPPNHPVFTTSTLHSLHSTEDGSKSPQKSSKAKSAFKTNRSVRRVLDFSDTKLSPLLVTNASSISQKATVLTTAAQQNSKIDPISVSIAPHNPLRVLPEPLLFLIADSLLKGMDGLKEVTRLFTQLAHSRRNPAENKQKTLELIQRFINRPGHNHIYDILKIVEYKVENIPDSWKEALQTATTIRLQELQNPTQVKNTISFFPALQTLELNKCTLDADSFAAISNLQALQTLKFSVCKGITDSNFTPINNCRALTSLTVSWCEAGLSDAGIKALTLRKKEDNSPPNKLKKLILDGNRQLTDEGLIHITKAFPALEILHFGGCLLITENGFAHITKLTELRSLNLTFCKGLFKSGLDTVVKLKKLETLILKRFDFVNHNNFPSLLPLAQLKHLDLRYASSITDNILNKIYHILPQLSYFSIYKGKGFSSNTILDLSSRTSLDVQQSSSPIPCDKPPEVSYDSKTKK